MLALEALQLYAVIMSDNNMYELDDSITKRRLFICFIVLALFLRYRLYQT